ncbi:hypothetical protein [Saccharopolyspora sp. ASAGF58]|uniref:hypothetical protein n=1 Tax=Saccharopolyspora sp. ASAGF58 TaxID=2719023 RepID=UPI0014470B3A|nr:hypothetical protein [Saccharopolyspora sp. ASAGF58]
MTHPTHTKNFLGLMQIGLRPLAPPAPEEAGPFASRIDTASLHAEVTTRVVWPPRST